MAKLTEADLKKQIKDGTFDNLYFIYGEEKLLVKLYTDKLREKIAGKIPSDFNCHIFNGQANVNDIAVAANIIPFAQPVNYVELQDIALEAYSDKEFENFLQLLDDIPSGTTLTISLPTTNTGGKKPARWRKLADIVTKKGSVAVFDKKSPQELKKQIVSWAAKRDITITSANAQLILEYCGNDLQTLKNEMEKLCAYTGSGEIKAKDIEILVTKNLEARVFDMADAVVKGDYDSAFTKLDLLLYQREEPINILAVLGSSYIDMYRVRTAVENGENPQTFLTQFFDYKRKEFRIAKAQRIAKGLTTEALTESLNILCETNAKLNSSSGDKRILLEQLIGRLIMAGKRA